MSPPVLCLVGMPGSGKSTVGRLLAGRLDRRFVDLDREVERRQGRTVAEIFAVEGEAAFRRHEADALATLVDGGRPLVVAAGGGIVCGAGGRAALERTCCVWLQADLPTLTRRVGPDGGGRPLLTGDPRGRLAQLAAERASGYAAVAGHQVATDGRTPDEVASAVLAAIGAAPAESRAEGPR